MEKQLGDDAVMDSLLDLGIVSTIFAAMAVYLSKLGSDLRKEAQEKKKDLWAPYPVLNDILLKFKYRETYPAVNEIVEFYDEVRDVRKDIKPEDLIRVPQHLDKINEQMKYLRENLQDNQNENAISIILETVNYFDWVRSEKKRLELEDVSHDPSNIEEIENRLRKLKKAFQEEEKIRRIHQDLGDYRDHAGWLLILTASFSFGGIFLVGIIPIYFSISSLFFWLAELVLFIVPISLAVKKYRKSNELEKIFLNYKMEYAKSRPYYREPGGGE